MGVFQDFIQMKQSHRIDPYPKHATRLGQLRKLKQLILENEDVIVNALNQDFGCRARNETVMAEILNSLSSIDHAIKNLGRWMRKQPYRTSFWSKPARTYAFPQPRGVVGIIAPWNYSLDLSISPLVAALAAGNRAMVCMSPETPHLFELVHELISKNFERTEVLVYLGNDDFSPQFSALPFDHLLFTGSTRVGRLVAQAAAKNLTPVTLELGGKSPAVIGPDYDVEVAAERITWGKSFNAGQTCIAPDYVFVPSWAQERFVKATLAKFARSFHAMEDPDLTAIISERFYNRLTNLVEEAQAGGATLIRPEGYEPIAANGLYKFPLTLVLNAPRESTLMQEEIFGPILPVLTYNKIEDVIAYITDRDHPLSLYCFSNDRRLIDKLQTHTISGSFGLNETLIQYMQEDMAFGGVGASGQGAYHGKAGFDTFSHSKSVFEQFSLGKFTGLKLLHPPYTPFANRLLNLMTR